MKQGIFAPIYCIALETIQNAQIKLHAKDVDLKPMETDEMHFEV